MSLEVDGSKYFLVHHTEADTVDKIDPADFARCVAAMTAMAYVVADMPQRLGEARARSEPELVVGPQLQARAPEHVGPSFSSVTPEA